MYSAVSLHCVCLCVGDMFETLNEPDILLHKQQGMVLLSGEKELNLYKSWSIVAK